MNHIVKRIPGGLDLGEKARFDARQNVIDAISEHEPGDVLPLAPGLDVKIDKKDSPTPPFKILGHIIDPKDTEKNVSPENKVNIDLKVKKGNTVINAFKKLFHGDKAYTGELEISARPSYEMQVVGKHKL